MSEEVVTMFMDILKLQTELEDQINDIPRLKVEKEAMEKKISRYQSDLAIREGGNHNCPKTNLEVDGEATGRNAKSPYAHAEDNGEIPQANGGGH